MTDAAPPTSILIVDDEARNCRLLEALLLPEGYITRTASSGAEALASIARQPPDLILLDVMMPGMTGNQVATHLKANPETAGIPIVMVTAQIDRAARLASLDAGAEEFLTKPVDRAELWLRVRNLLRLKALAAFHKDHNRILEREVRVRTADLQQFRTAMDATRDAILMVDRTTMRFIEVNATASSMLGYTREEMLELDVAAIGFVRREDLARLFDAVIAGHALQTETRMRRKDGTGVEVEVGRHAHRSGDGWIIVAVVRDIDERKASEARITYLTRVHAMLDGINTLSLRARDREELFAEACRIAVEAGGFHMAMIAVLEGESVVPMAWGGDDDELRHAVEKLLAGHQAHATMVSQAISGRLAVVANDSLADVRVRLGPTAGADVRSIAMLPLLVAGKAIGALGLYARETGFFQGEEMTLLAGLAANVAFAADHIGKQERLDHLAYYDGLTGLANRSLLLDRLSQMVQARGAAASEPALMLLDLERFRDFNNGLGRESGDVLLRQVAAWLSREFGDASRLARVGADQFAVLLPGTGAAGEHQRLLEGTMQRLMDHPFRLNEAVFHIAARSGVARFPMDGDRADALYRNAEAALKLAKASGPRLLFYQQDMSIAAAGKLTLASQLREALEREEFVLHYQPRVNLANGKVVGAEAVIRWNGAATGMVPPALFIPVLEETGLINDVGRWALRQAVTDYLRWRAAGLPGVPIAVNVSPTQLHHAGFVEEIARIIAVDPDAAAGLEIDVDEDLVMQDVQRSIATLEAIRALGIAVAIDHFGSGLSSLSNLSRLPVTTLKIHPSFAVDLTAGPHGLALMSTFIRFGHSFGFKMVADGVTTEDQSRLLRLLNCDQIQGALPGTGVDSAAFQSACLAAQACGIEQTARAHAN